jgi:hypothetical protein
MGSRARAAALIAAQVLLPGAAGAQESAAPAAWDGGLSWILAGVLVLGAMAAVGVLYAHGGRAVPTRPVPGIEATEDAIGRAVEMGRPVVFVPGTQSITKAGTIAGMSVLRLVAEKCAQAGARLLVPCRDTIVTSIARETVESAYVEAGRRDVHRPTDVFFISDSQLPYTAGVCGVLEREHPATVFLQGDFSAESLIFGETANHVGALSIAGTDKETQLPFFVTTCDYTLVGEELYGAGAAISRSASVLGSLRGVDLGRLVVVGVLVLGLVLEIAGVPLARTILGGAG